MFLWLFAVLVVVTMAYVRLAPSDPARWHVDVPAFEKTNYRYGAIRVIDGDADVLARLDKIILSAPSRRIAGSVGEGHITYVTRTRWMGFPDYTTVQMKDGKIAIFGRLRFGGSDARVNGKRIKGWLAQLG